MELTDRVVVITGGKRIGRIDVLVNMASVYGSRPFDELTEADWDRDLTFNLKSAFLCAKAAVPAMRASGGGRIINFADWLARSGRPTYQGFVPHYVAKAGIIALTEALALALAGDQILVNAIAPGPILAPPDMDPEEIAAIAKATPNAVALGISRQELSDLAPHETRLFLVRPVPRVWVANDLRLRE